MTKKQKNLIKSGIVAGAVALVLGVGLGVGLGVKDTATKQNTSIINEVNGQVSISPNQTDFLTNTNVVPIININSTISNKNASRVWYLNGKKITNWTGVSYNNQAPSGSVLQLANNVSNSGTWQLSILVGNTKYNSNSININISNTNTASNVYSVSLTSNKSSINDALATKTATLTANVNLNKIIENYTDQGNKIDVYNLSYTYNLYDASTNTLLQTIKDTTNTSATFNVTNDSSSSYYVSVIGYVNDETNSIGSVKSNIISIQVVSNSDFSAVGSLSKNSFTPILNGSGDVSNNTNITYNVTPNFPSNSSKTSTAITYYYNTTNSTNTTNATLLSSNVINTSNLKQGTYYVFAKINYTYTNNGNVYSSIYYTSPSVLNINSSLVGNGITINNYTDPIIYGNGYNSNETLASQTPSISITNNNNLTINSVSVISSTLSANIIDDLNNIIVNNGSTYSLDFSKLPSGFNSSSLFENNQNFSFKIVYSINGLTNTINSNAFSFQSIKVDASLPNSLSTQTNDTLTLSATVNNGYNTSSASSITYWYQSNDLTTLNTVLNSYNSSSNTFTSSIQPTSATSYSVNTSSDGTVYVGAIVINTYTINGKTIYSASNIAISTITISAIKTNNINNVVYISSSNNTEPSYAYSNISGINVSNQVTNALPTWTLKANSPISASVLISNSALSSFSSDFSYDASAGTITINNQTNYNNLLKTAISNNITSISLSFIIDGVSNNVIKTALNINEITPSIAITSSNSILSYDKTSGDLASPLTINATLNNSTYFSANSSFSITYTYNSHTISLKLGANTFSNLNNLLGVSSYDNLPSSITLSNSTYGNLVYSLSQEALPSISITNSTTPTLTLPVLNSSASSEYSSLISTTNITAPVYNLQFANWNGVTAFNIKVSSSNSNLNDIGSYFDYDFESGQVVINNLIGLLTYLNNNASSLSSVPLTFTLYTNQNTTPTNSINTTLDLNIITPQVNVTSSVANGNSVNYNIYTNDDNFITSNAKGISLSYSFSDETLKYFNTSQWQVSVNANNITSNALSTVNTYYDSISSLFGSNYSSLNTKVHFDTSNLNIVASGITFNITNASNPSFILNPTSVNDNSATMTVSGNNSTNVTYEKGSNGDITITSNNYTSPTFNVSLTDSNGDVLSGYDNYNVVGASIDGTSVNNIASLKGSLTYNNGVLSINSSNYSTFLNTVAKNYLSSNPNATSMPLTLDLVTLNTNNTAIATNSEAVVSVGLYGIVSTNENTTGYALDVSPSLVNESAFNAPVLNVNLPALPNGQSYSIQAYNDDGSMGTNDLGAMFELKDNAIQVSNSEFSTYMNTLTNNGTYTGSVSNTIVFSIVYDNITYLTYTYTQNVIANPNVMTYNSDTTLSATYNIVNSDINKQSNVLFNYTSIGKKLLNVQAIQNYITNNSPNWMLQYSNGNAYTSSSDISFTSNGISIPSSALVTLMQQGLANITSSVSTLSTYATSLLISNFQIPLPYIDLTPDVTYNSVATIQFPEISNTNIISDTAYENYTFSTNDLSNYIGDDMVVGYGISSNTSQTITNIIPITSSNASGSSFNYFNSNAIALSSIQNMATMLKEGGMYELFSITIMSPSQISSNSISIGSSSTLSNTLITNNSQSFTTYYPTFSLTSNMNDISISSDGTFSSPLTITLTPSSLTNKLYNLSDTLFYGGDSSFWSQLHTGTNTFNSLSELFEGDAYLDSNGKYTSLSSFLKDNQVFSYHLVGGLYTKGLTSSSTESDLDSASFSANSSNSLTFNFSEKSSS